MAVPAHRKMIRHYHEPGHLHELTFSCYRRLPLLTNDSWRFELVRSMEEAGKAAEMDLLGYVIMPEHLHLLVQPRQSSAKISLYLARIKQPFSKRIKGLLAASGSALLERLTVRERAGKLTFRFWQEGAGYDRNLFTPAAIRASLEYIHNNPVKRGLCQTAIEWKWSSARHYLSNQVSDGQVPTIAALPEGCLS